MSTTITPATPASAATTPARTSSRRGKAGRLSQSLVGLALSVTAFTAFTAVDQDPVLAAPIDVDEDGQWGPVEDWPMVGIHAALDSNGRVVTYGTNSDGTQTGQFIYDIWNPEGSAGTGHNTLANTTETDLFCSLQLNRSDTGDLVIFGGDNWTGEATNNRGNPDINQLSASTGQLSSLPGMQRSRWYGTGTTLPDGSVYVQGGLGGEDHPEHWSPETGSRLLDIDTSGIDWYYPRNFVAPDGRVFGIDTQGRMYFVSEQLDSLDVVGRLDPEFWGNQTTAVMFEPGRILFFGGQTARSLVIDITSGNPVVTPTDNISSVRYWVNGTLLPDGRVMASGGSAKNSTEFFDDPINTYGVNNAAEIWDPKTGLWTEGSDAAVPRLYHSTALLLPDGRVLTAGGGSPGPVSNTDAEIYSPDYLVAENGQPTPRLTIQGVTDTEFSAGEDVALTVSAGADVSRVTLVKSGSVTHSFNMDQRFLELPFTTNGNRVRATLPVNDATLTPGFYLLSVLDENDIPSESEVIHVQAPTPTELNSTIDGEVIRLYRAYFLRNPDQGGYLFWRRSLLNGIGLAEISDFFSTSPEFVGRYGSLSNAQFVDQVYGNVLDRPADAEGRAYWIDQLATGVTRGQVMLAFSESPEFVRQTGTGNLNAGTAVAPNPIQQPAPVAGPQPVAQFEPEIRRLYLGYFQRNPDLGGAVHWTTQRAGGLTLAEVSEEFALSTEFQTRYGQTSNAAFVDLVYLNVLGRPADPDGRTYWIGQLADGVTRGELMTGFTESPEFIAKVG